MAILGKVSDAESDEIKTLMERKGALEDLFLILGKQGEMGIEVSTTQLYDRIVDDMKNVRKEVSNWWLRVSEKHSWQYDPENSWTVDFSSNEVHLK